MRYFISPVEMTGTLETATHIVFAYNHHSFKSIYEVMLNIKNIRRITGTSAEVIITHPFELCTIVKYTETDKMPDGLKDLFRSGKIFQIGDPKELEKYDCTTTADEWEEWKEVSIGCSIRQGSAQALVNDTNGNEYRSLPFTTQTDFKMWNVDKKELSDLAFNGFMIAMNKMKNDHKLTDNLKQAIVMRFLNDTSKNDDSMLLYTKASKLTKRDKELFVIETYHTRGVDNWYHGTTTIQKYFNYIISACRPIDLMEDRITYLKDHVLS